MHTYVCEYIIRLYVSFTSFNNVYKKTNDRSNAMVEFEFLYV